MTQDQPITTAGSTTPIRLLPSGRTIQVTAEGGSEAIEIRSASGDMEVRIALTDQGPVLQLKGARLQIDSTDTVAVNCKDFEINAANNIRLTSAANIEVLGEGEMKFKAKGSTWIDADFVNLNCLDRRGYHDYQVGGSTPPAPLPPPPAPDPAAGSCTCCDHHEK